MNEESTDSTEEMPQNLREIAISMMGYSIITKSTFPQDTLTVLAKLSMSLLEKARKLEKKS